MKLKGKQIGFFVTIAVGLLLTIAHITNADGALKNETANNQEIEKVNIPRPTPVPKSNKLPVEYNVEWDFTEYDFGEISEGTKADSVVFYFTAKTDVMMTGSTSHCGCTTGKWTPKRLKKGERGSITLKYDTNRLGYFNKYFEVFFNRNSKPEKLYIKGKVRPITD